MVPESSVEPSTSEQHQVPHRAQLTPVAKRQAGVGNVNAGYPSCNDVGNEVLSCFPRSDSVLMQDEWSKFIWNPNYPTFKQRGSLDIYVFDAASEDQISSWANITNSRGSIGILPDDTWLPSQSAWADGSTVTHSYYFVVATQGARDPNALTHQATFRMLQTAAPASLSWGLSAANSAQSAAASLSSASASLNSVMNSLASEGLLTVSISSGLVPGSTSTGSSSSRHPNGPSSLQDGTGGGSDVPKWAIALIVVLGTFALAAALAAAWFILRLLRRRREAQYSHANENSAEDISPIMGEKPNKAKRPDSSALESDPGRLSTGTGTGSGPAWAAGAAGLTGSAISKDGPPLQQAASGNTVFGGSAASDAMMMNGSSVPPGYSTPSEGRRSTSPRQNSLPSTLSPLEQRLLSSKPSTRSLTGAIGPAEAAIISGAFREGLRRPEFPHSNANSGDFSCVFGHTAGSTEVPPSPRSANTAMPDSPIQSGSDDAAENSSAENSSGDASKEADNLLKHELASEGASVQSLAERKKPDIHHD